MKTTNKKIGYWVLGTAGLMINGLLQAAMPMWTFSAPNPARLALAPAEIGTVEYTVTNQSKKAKALLVQPKHGLSAPVCHLAGKGSTCTLTLTVSGSQIPENGIHSGPMLCEQRNPNQCYQPGATRQLEIVRSSTPGHLLLSHNGLPINTLALAPGDSGTLVLSNTGGTSVSSLAIGLPWGWQSYFTNSCPALLAPQQSCSIVYAIPTPSAVGILNRLSIQGAGADNSLSLPVSIQALGPVKCWGNNFNGQLGDGSTTNSSTPVSVNTITNAVAIAAGGSHTCALLDTGAINCWGYNGFGQLGDGSTTDSHIPITVNTITNAVAITSGAIHACALLNTGVVNCWGYNNSGQLGNGSTTDSSTPVSVNTITNAVAISAGQHYTCALLDTGAVNCWGWNIYGQLGDGSTTDSSTPVTVSTITNAVAISAGIFHTCALLNTGVVNCWGWNGEGELGDGTTNNSSTPVTVNTITNAVAISAGSGHTCALLDTGAVYCWGYNEFGQLGDGSTTDSSTPVAVNTITNAVAISAGGNHTCALLDTGEVNCWGNNAAGQLGDDSTTDSNTPVTTCSGPGCPGNLNALGILANNILSGTSCAIVP